MCWTPAFVGIVRGRSRRWRGGTRGKEGGVDRTSAPWSIRRFVFDKCWEGPTSSAALVSHHLPLIFSPSPFSIWRASVMVSCRRCSWLNIKLALSGSPVHALTSTISRLWLTRFRTDTSCCRTSSGALGEFDRHNRVALPRAGVRELRRSWISYYPNG